MRSLQQRSLGPSPPLARVLPQSPARWHARVRAQAPPPADHAACTRKTLASASRTDLVEESPLRLVLVLALERFGLPVHPSEARPDVEKHDAIFSKSRADVAGRDAVQHCRFARGTRARTVVYTDIGPSSPRTATLQFTQHAPHDVRHTTSAIAATECFCIREDGGGMTRRVLRPGTLLHSSIAASNVALPRCTVSRSRCIA